MNNKKILVCDDDPGILEMLELILEEEGYEVVLEDKSVNALKKIKAEAPGLVLLDIWMPVISGDQVLRAMKADGMPMPVLMYSASTDGKAIANAAGADEFLAKPFDIDVLLNSVSRLLER
ncbi:response regulator [Pedobacter boryungensis]|uniref:Response regulator n=1 Tax=Pedobacter boryungensis TaxID=869962 RepID=A0ABX2DB55_9SPHI|nr:response regulator [Pedobacter boryungensis]NQX31072.1 response regulator [Pedobacter boryungensis]